MKRFIENQSNSNNKVVIIAGGKGTRLSELTYNIPKPMLKINGKPLLEHIVQHTKKYGIIKFLFKIGYLSDKIQNYFGDGSKFGCKIEYYVENELQGTCGGLGFLKEEKKPVIVIYGDTFINVNLTKLLNYHCKKKAQATLIVHQTDHPEDSDIVVIDEDNDVIKIVHKPIANKYTNLSNAALYVLNPECFSIIPEIGKYDFAKDLIPELIERNYKVVAYHTEEYIKDMGTIMRYQEVNKDIMSGKIFNRVDAVFLDRDGVINEEIGLINKKEMLTLLPDASHSIKLLNNANIPAIVITNQPVVAKNLCTICELEEIHSYLCELLENQGAYLDQIYYCPHHPDKGFPEEIVKYKCNCQCRKPNIGMLVEAQQEFNINLNKSFVIGDSTGDILTGANAGCRTILVKTGHKGKDKKYNASPEYIFECLSDAVSFIIKYNATSLEKIIDSIKYEIKKNSQAIVIIGGVSRKENYSLMKKINNAYENSLFVIDIDVLIKKNILFHGDISISALENYILSSLNKTTKRVIAIVGRNSLDISFLLHLSNIKIFVDSYITIKMGEQEEVSGCKTIEYTKKTSINADFVI